MSAERQLGAGEEYTAEFPEGHDQIQGEYAVERNGNGWECDAHEDGDEVCGDDRKESLARACLLVLFARNAGVKVFPLAVVVQCEQQNADR